MAMLRQEVTAWVGEGIAGSVVADSQFIKAFGKVETIDLGASSVFQILNNSVSAPTQVGNQWRTDLLSAKLNFTGLEIPTNLIQAKYSYTAIDKANYDRMTQGKGGDYANLLDQAVRNSIDMQVRNLAIQGNGTNLGLVNNATVVNLSANWTRLSTEVLLKELLGALNKLMVGCLNRGKDIKILCSQKLYSYINTSIIQSTTFIQNGSSQSIGGALKSVIEGATGYNVEILYDATLSSSTKESMLIIIPDVSKRNTIGDNNVGEFNIENSAMTYHNTYIATSTLDLWQDAPRGGVYEVTYSLNASSGVNLRNYATIKIEQTF